MPLTAEKHAKLPCVTISVDDIFFNGSAKLAFHLLTQLFTTKLHINFSIGHVLTLEAIVNRSFTSSLEVSRPFKEAVCDSD